MPTYILTSYSCAKRRWWCRNVRCRCLFIERQVDQLCEIEAPTVSVAAALLGGNASPNVLLGWDVGQSYKRIGRQTAHPFTPGITTTDVVRQLHPMFAFDAASFSSTEHFERVRRELTDFIRTAFADTEREWCLVIVPRLVRNVADSPWRASVEEPLDAEGAAP